MEEKLSLSLPSPGNVSDMGSCIVDFLLHIIFQYIYIHLHTYWQTYSSILYSVMFGIYIYYIYIYIHTYIHTHTHPPLLYTCVSQHTKSQKIPGFAILEAMVSGPPDPAGPPQLRTASRPECLDLSISGLGKKMRDSPPDFWQLGKYGKMMIHYKLSGYLIVTQTHQDRPTCKGIAFIEFVLLSWERIDM